MYKKVASAMEDNLAIDQKVKINPIILAHVFNFSLHVLKQPIPTI